MQAADAKLLTQAVEPESSTGEDTGSDEHAEDSSHSTSANRKLSGTSSEEDKTGESKTDTAYFRESLPTNGQALTVSMGSYLFPPQGNSKQSIPDEVAARILSFLDPKSIVRASGVARSWYLETRRLLHFNTSHYNIYKPITAFDDEMRAALTARASQIDEDGLVPTEIKSIPTQVEELHLFEYLMARYEPQPGDENVPLVLHEDGKVTGYALEGKPTAQFEALVANYFTQRFPWFAQEINQDSHAPLSSADIIEILIHRYEIIKPAIASWTLGVKEPLKLYHPSLTGSHLRRTLFDIYRCVLFFKQPHYYKSYALLNSQRYDNTGMVANRHNEQSFHHFVMHYLGLFIWKVRDLESLFTDVLLLEPTMRELNHRFIPEAQAAALPTAMQRLCHPLYCYRLSRQAITIILSFEVFRDEKYILDITLETLEYQVLLRSLREEDWLVLGRTILPRPIGSNEPSSIFRALRDNHPIVVNAFTEKGFIEILQGRPQFIPFVLSNPTCLAKLSRKGFIEIARSLGEYFADLYTQSEHFRQAIIQHQAIGPIGYHKLDIPKAILRIPALYKSLTVLEYFHLFSYEFNNDEIFNNGIISEQDERRFFKKQIALKMQVIESIQEDCKAGDGYEVTEEKPVIEDFTTKFERWQQTLSERYQAQRSVAGQSRTIPHPNRKPALDGYGVLKGTFAATNGTAKPLAGSNGSSSPPEQSDTFAASQGASPYSFFAASKTAPTPTYITVLKGIGYTILIAAGLYFLSTGIGALITGFMLGITYSIAPYVIAAAGLELIATAALFILTRNPALQTQVDAKKNPSLVAEESAFQQPATTSPIY